jgi:hypothetical protein
MTVSFANLSLGGNITLVITQGTGGNKAAIWPGNMKFAGGQNSLSTDQSSTDIVSVFNAGSTIYAAITTGYV